MKLLGKKKELDKLYKIFDGELRYGDWERILKWLKKYCEWKISK